MWDENKVRISDIAEECGVSTATVSNVLHGKTARVSEATAVRVRACLEERGYIPNMAATLLAENSSRIIGVVVKDHAKYEGHVLEDPFVSAAVNALADEIDASGNFMMVKKAKDIMEIVTFASMWNVDGMVVLSFCADEYVELRQNIRIPFVVYDGFFDNTGRISNLMIDDFDGGRQVGAHFRERGFRNVLCVADNAICMDAARIDGFRAGFCETASCEPIKFWEIPMFRDERLQFYENRKNDFRNFDAVFAVSDYYAVDLMRFLQASGFRIPEDIAVAGFDDSPLCMQVSPNLTSVRQDNAERARQAVELLRKMKADRDFSEDCVLPVTLIARESTLA